MELYKYKGKRYPEYLKHGNASAFIAAAALKFCEGSGLDIGAGKYPLAGARPIDLEGEFNAYKLPYGRMDAGGKWDYIFSSHCLEHLPDPVKALEYWKEVIAPGGPLFLYLPHPDMEYWLPQNNRKHFHSWRPEEVAKILSDLGYIDVIHSERDLYWSFSVVGRVPFSTKREEEVAFGD